MLEKNSDTVKIVFKHLPLNMHNMARPAALAAIAAQNQGKFWQMHDALFDLPKLTKKNIEKAAQDIGLNMEQFNKDLNSPKTKEKLVRDLRSAKEADISGTPTLLINGHKVKSRGQNTIQQMIDQQVARSKTPSSN